MKIEDWRARINAIDDELVVLLNKRFSLAAETVRQKQREKLPIRDSKREQEIRLRAHQSNLGPMDRHAIDKIFGLIISESRRVSIEAANASAIAATSRLYVMISRAKYWWRLCFR